MLKNFALEKRKLQIQQTFVNFIVHNLPGHIL